MKKTMLLLCSIMVSTGMIMAGCEKETPTDVVNTYFSTLKTGTIKEILGAIIFPLKYRNKDFN